MTEPLRWSDTKSLGLRDRLRIFLSAFVCQHVAAWTCAECKYWREYK